MSTHVTGLILLSLLAVLTCSFPGESAAAGTGTKSTATEETKKQPLKMFFVPVFGYSTDEGFVFGGLGGMMKQPHLILYPNAYYSTAGRVVAKIEGEAPLGHATLAGKAAFRRVARKLYSPVGNANTLAKATVDRLEIELSILRSMSERVKIGPDVEIDISQAEKIRDADGNPITAIPGRFEHGSSLLTGVRFRLQTTEPLRPVNGVILDASVRGGRSSGDSFITPRADLAADLRGAWAQPLTRRIRLYMRGLSRFQLEAPPPVRNHLGGETTVRGHVEHRDFGRRLIAGRAQMHWTAIPELNWLSNLLHTLWSRFPRQTLQFETVLFFDTGAIGDPDFGWRHTRTGYGAGMRIVLPPTLVAHFDIGYSEYGGYRIYLGAGETL